MPYPDGSSLHVDSDIAVLKSKVEDLEQNQNILFERCRANEKWIAGAGAVIAAVVALAAIMEAVDAKTVQKVDKAQCESTGMCISQTSSKNY
jgi:hypothetical protein